MNDREHYLFACRVKAMLKAHDKHKKNFQAIDRARFEEARLLVEQHIKQVFEVYESTPSLFASVEAEGGAS